MGKTFTFLVFMFVFVFSSGFIIGYFLDRSSIVYTQSEMDVLKDEIESMQLQEMFASAEAADCKLIYTAMGKTSYDLYDLVNRLKETSPESWEFMKIKKDADLLSLKTWMTAKKIKKTCSADILPILFLYSDNCPECDIQDVVLQELKDKYNNTLVYAIDIKLNEPVTNLIKVAYDIDSVPAMIIGNVAYGKLDFEQLKNITCEQVTC